MKEVRYFYVPNASFVGELPEEEAKRAARVLRLQSGDQMILVDGEGGLFNSEVSMVSNKHCLYILWRRCLVSASGMVVLPWASLPQR